MGLKTAAAVRVAAADAAAALCNGALIRFYTGTEPDVDAAATGTLLAELTMGSPAFGAASDDGTNATATANAIADDTSANATGTAGYFRIFASNGTTALMQGSVSLSAGGGDMIMSSVDIVAGGTVSISSLTYAAPQA